MKDFAFMDHAGFQVQQYAKKYFYDSLKDGGLAEVGYSSVDFFAFKTTGGSNLDPEDPQMKAENCFPWKMIFAQSTTSF